VRVRTTVRVKVRVVRFEKLSDGNAQQHTETCTLF